MKKKSRKEDQEIGIVEAVETLSNIADLDFDAEIGVTQKHHIVIQDKELTYRTVHWMAEDEPSTTIRAVRDTFRVVLNYIKDFYKQKYSPTDWKNLEGMENLMVLVGEAAKKLDRYTSLFKKKNAGSVMNLKEFRQLQTFYRNKIAKEETDRERMEKLFSSAVTPMAKITAKRTKKEEKIDPKKIFVDFEAVKRDTEYELFYLRKEGTKRFFNQRLIRNMKLVCDFGGSFGAREITDPLVNLEEWQDRMYHVAACDILDSVEVEIERFFRLASKFRSRELVALLHYAVMALYLCRNSANLERNQPVKNCQYYFNDFQKFLRKALESTDYQHNLVYHPSKANRVDVCLMNLAHALCSALYCKIRGHREILRVINGLIRSEGIEAGPKKSIGILLRKHEQVYRKVVGRHPNGPLFKILDSLSEKVTPEFDPLMQGNLPHYLFDIFVADRKYTHLRVPCPTHQGYIAEAEVVPEFKGMLRAYARHPQAKRHLHINLQDRTSWKEHARSRAVESLQKQEEFRDELVVVTLPKSTDFYHQLPPYDELGNAQEFIDAMIAHIRSDASGFFFEKELRAKALGPFVEKVISGIHDVFFGNRKKLSLKDRLCFIELLYMFIILRILESIDPSSFSLSCKDAVDVGAAATGSLYGFLELLDRDVEPGEVIANLGLFFFEPALMVRERDILAERFERAIAMLEHVEHVREKAGSRANFRKKLVNAFGKVFKTPIFEPHISIPRRRHHAIAAVGNN